MKTKKKTSKKKKKTKAKSIDAFSTTLRKAKQLAGIGGQSSQMIRRRKLYSPESLQAAYKAVKDSSISVNAAAKQYGVPLTTLRDRVDGRISIDTTRPGPPLLMTREEEAEIAQFLHTMAKYGYRYTRLGLAEIATDQAIEKGKRPLNSSGLTTKWVDCFVNRWPGVRELSSKFKNKTEAEHTVRTYFDEIKKVIDRYRLLEKPNRIFNVMEVNLYTDHSLLPEFGNKTYGSHDFKTENVTNTTMLICGSVTGDVLPPYFIFQSSSINPAMLKRANCNVNASVSDTGKCNPMIFRRFLNEHFLPHCERFECEPILVIMDGSRSHMFVGLKEWGRRNNVIFSFIPAHTTHLLQPLEVECSQALQKKYEAICKKHLRITSNPCISRTSICELACQAFSRVMTKHAVIHSFKKAGVLPDVSSDESGDENDCDLDVNFQEPESELADADNLDEVDVEEVVYTEDLVVGQNQEVVEEEEVVTSQEVFLSEEDQLVLGPGTEAVMIIQGGDIFVTDKNNSSFSPLELMSSDTENAPQIKSEPLIGEPLTESKCIINNGKIISTERLESMSGFNSFIDTSFTSSEGDFVGVHGSKLIEDFNVANVKCELLDD